MMKINPERKKSGVGKRKSKDDVGGGEPFGLGGSSKVERSSNFNEILEVRKEEVYDKAIFAMMSEVDRLGQQLRDFPSIADYQRYQVAVKKIVKSLVPNAFSIQKSFSRPSVNRPQTKEYHILTAVDQELLSLLDLIREKEKDHMRIAGQVVKIKGMLVDCYR